MVERWRDPLVFVLFIACSTGTYAAARVTGTDDPLPSFLPLVCATAFVVYKAASWLLRQFESASTQAEFLFPVYVLRDSAGRVLCTDEPDGGYLAVFTSLDAATRFREVRSVFEWSPASFDHTELLDVLQFAKRSGRVQFVMIDPLVGQYGFAPTFPLSHCIERLGG